MVKKVSAVVIVTVISILFLSLNVFAIVCPKCNANNVDKAKFCNECGAKLEETKSEKVKSSKSSKSSAVVFDGVGYLNVPISDSLTDDFFASDNWTLEIWVNPAELNRFDLFVGFWCHPRIFYSGGLILRGEVKKSLTNIFDTEPGVFTENTWTHVAITSNGKIYELYMNGVSKLKRVYKKFDGGVSKFVIGSTADADDQKYNFKGMMDDVRIYNRALTADEVKSNFEKQNITQKGLISWWKFDGDTKDVMGKNDAEVVGEITYEMVE